MEIFWGRDECSWGGRKSQGGRYKEKKEKEKQIRYFGYFEGRFEERANELWLQHNQVVLD